MKNSKNVQKTSCEEPPYCAILLSGRQRKLKSGKDWYFGGNFPVLCLIFQASPITLNNSRVGLVYFIHQSIFDKRSISKIYPRLFNTPQSLAKLYISLYLRIKFKRVTIQLL
jgi:hypothetical protein